MSENVKLLQTGGWDSTFRLLQLLLVEKGSVQPIYVIDLSRYSTQKELEALACISGTVKQRLEQDVTLFLKLIYLRSNVQGLKEWFTTIKKRFHLGTQYYWLAVIADNLKWGSVKLSMEKYQAAPSEPQKAIFNDIDGDHPTLKDTWEAELFKYWKFPLVTTTKSQMRDIAEQHSFIDILSKRRFCMRPIRGKCCGSCRPCEIAIAEGATDSVEFVHPIEAAARKLLRRLRK